MSTGTLLLWCCESAYENLLQHLQEDVPCLTGEGVGTQKVPLGPSIVYVKHGKLEFASLVNPIWLGFSQLTLVTGTPFKQLG